MTDFSVENVKTNARQVYADSAYFNDTLKEVEGIDAIEAYLLESLAATEEVRVEISDVAESNGNYYFIWVMDIKFKNLKKRETTRSIGMSHIRFDREGKVVLHQDYWDAATGLYQHIPIIGRLIRGVKNRL